MLLRRQGKSWESGAGAGVTADGEFPEQFRSEGAEGGHEEDEEYFRGGLEGLGEDFSGDIGDEQHRDSVGEDGLERAAEGGIGPACEVKKAIVGPDDALGLDGPEADAGEDKHEGIVDEDAGEAEGGEREDLGAGGLELQVVAGVGHDGEGGGGVDEGAEVELAHGDDEPGIDGEEEEEVEFAGSD